MRDWLKDRYGVEMPDPLTMMGEEHPGPMSPMSVSDVSPEMLTGTGGTPAHHGRPMAVHSMPHIGMADGMDMMNDYAALPPPRLEAVFMSLMIAHHEGALRLAEEAVDQAQHPEVRDLATRIFAGQSAEIDRMNRWIEDWYGL